VLNVAGCEDIDSRFEQLLRVLPTLGMARAGRIRMRKFVYKHDLRMPGENAINVHLLQLHAAIVDLFPRGDRQSCEQRIRLRAAMSFNIADHQIAPRLQLALCGFQHRVGLANARAHAEENLEASALSLRRLALERGQQSIRAWARRLSHGSKLN